MKRITLPLAAAVIAATTSLAFAQAPGGQGTMGGSAHSPTSDGTNQGGPFSGSPTVVPGQPTVVVPSDQTGSVVIIDDGAAVRTRPDGLSVNPNGANPGGGATTANPNR